MLQWRGRWNVRQIDRWMFARRCDGIRWIEQALDNEMNRWIGSTDDFYCPIVRCLAKIETVDFKDAITRFQCSITASWRVGQDMFDEDTRYARFNGIARPGEIQFATDNTYTETFHVLISIQCYCSRWSPQCCTQGFTINNSGLCRLDTVGIESIWITVIVGRWRRQGLCESGLGIRVDNSGAAEKEEKEKRPRVDIVTMIYVCFYSGGIGDDVVSGLSMWSLNCLASSPGMKMTLKPSDERSIEVEPEEKGFDCWSLPDIWPHRWRTSNNRTCLRIAYLLHIFIIYA